jgi:2-(3-amino-3-carboxypropyl)histidine synthase
MLKDLNYDLQIDKLVIKINEKKYKQVLLQFPDGLKMYSNEVVDLLKEKTKNCKFFIYFGTCYGACDLPIHLEKLNFDLCVQFGHSKFETANKS